MNRNTTSLPNELNRPKMPLIVEQSANNILPASLFLGVVVYVNTASLTASVMTGEGKIFNNVYIINKGASMIERSQTWLESYRGRQCLVATVNSKYIIIGTLPTDYISTDPLDDTLPFLQNETGADVESAYKSTDITYINQGRRDYLDGDKVMTTSDNVSMGLFKGGLINLKVSNLTQLILHKLKALFRIVTRNFELFTDFGKITITNKEDKTTCKLEGGASFKNETMPGVEKYSVDITMGSIESDENQRLNIIVKDPANDSNKVELGLGIDGIIHIECSEKAEINSKKEIALTSQNDFTIDSKGALTLNAVKDINIISRKNVGLQSSGGSVAIKSTSDVTVTGNPIRLN